MPTVVTTPSRRPPRRTLRTTNIVSAPGVSVSSRDEDKRHELCVNHAFSPVLLTSLSRPTLAWHRRGRDASYPTPRTEPGVQYSRTAPR